MGYIGHFSDTFESTDNMVAKVSSQQELESLSAVTVINLSKWQCKPPFCQQTLVNPLQCCIINQTLAIYNEYSPVFCERCRPARWLVTEFHDIVTYHHLHVLLDFVGQGRFAVPEFHCPLISNVGLQRHTGSCPILVFHFRPATRTCML